MLRPLRIGQTLRKQSFSSAGFANLISPSVPHYGGSSLRASYLTSQPCSCCGHRLTRSVRSSDSAFLEFSESAAVSAAWAKISGCRDARIRECIEKTEKRFTSSSRCSQVHRDDGFFINSVISFHSILSKLLRSEATGRVWGVLSPI